MITCRTATELHTDAREGALTWWQRLGYRFHMRICPACQAYDKGFGQAVGALGGLPKEEAPSSVKQAALAKLRERSAPP